MNPQQVAPWVFLGLFCWALPLLDVKATARNKLVRMFAGFDGLFMCFMLRTYMGLKYQPLLAAITVVLTIVSVLKIKPASENVDSWAMAAFFFAVITLFLLFSGLELL